MMVELRMTERSNSVPADDLLLPRLACDQALCLGKKIARKGKGKGGREPVDKHLRPLLCPLVIILPNICQ